MDLGARLLAEVLGQHLAHQGNPRRAADEQHRVQLAGAQAGVLQGSVNRVQG